MRLLAEAGVAALEGHVDATVAGFAAAIEKFARGGSRMHVALPQLDGLTLLPDEPSIAGWAGAAGARLEAVNSRPLLALLDAAIAQRVV